MHNGTCKFMHGNYKVQVWTWGTVSEATRGYYIVKPFNYLGKLLPEYSGRPPAPEPRYLTSMYTRANSLKPTRSSNR